MKLFDLKNAGHWPTLLAAFLSPRGAEHGPHHKAEVETQIGEKPRTKGSDGRITDTGWRRLRILLGLLVDRVGAKNARIMAQLVVIKGWRSPGFLDCRTTRRRC